MFYTNLLTSTRRLYQAVTDMVFPETCWATGTILSKGEHQLSAEARNTIAQMLLWPYCGRCGMTTGHGTQHDHYHPCPACSTRDLGVNRIVRIGTFNEPLNTLIKTLKFQHRWELAHLLAPFLYQALAQVTHDGQRIPVDVLVPVPLHWQRHLQRGFNQSLELAQELGKLTGKPISDVLWRRRPTHAQSQVQSATARKMNLRKAFICTLPDHSADTIAHKHVWLIDDVTTTGATLHAAASALRRLPAGQRPAGIYAAVISVTDDLGARIFQPDRNLEL